MRITRKRSRDAQRLYPSARCVRCGGELYAGAPCWVLGGRTLCEDCLVPWLLAELAPFHIRCGEVRR